MVSILVFHSLLAFKLSVLYLYNAGLIPVFFLFHHVLYGCFICFLCILGSFLEVKV